MFSRRLILSLLLIGSFTASAQRLEVVGKFKSDSVKLGEPIEYYVTLKYPSHWQVLLPDSTYSFTPFEYQKKIYFPTHTLDSISTDSVLYILSTFEVDSIQTLRIPAFVVLPNDCTSYESNIDTVFFSHLVRSIPDSLSTEQLPLKANTSYNAVSWLFNYPVFTIIIVVIILLLLVGWLLFGKRIKRHYIIKRLNKNHQEFIDSFDRSIEKLKNGFSSEIAENSVLIWKKYMEELVTKPYTKSTTRELKEIENNDSLISALRVIDRSIYGSLPPESLASFISLKEYSRMQFDKKLEELNHE